MLKRLRYRDLVSAGIVNNRVTLANWIKKRGFPRGQRIGDNTRVWDQVAVETWLAQVAVTEPKPCYPMTPGKKRGRPRRADRAAAAPEA